MDGFDPKEEVMQTEETTESTPVEASVPQPQMQYQQPYQQPIYQQNAGWTGNEQQKKPGKGLGIAAMICGIASLVFFCMCINIPLAVAALITGILCLTKRDGAGKGMAIAGIVTAAASVLLFFLFFGLACASIGSIRPAEISEFYEDFSGDGWNPYDFRNDFDFDYEFDHDYDYEYDDRVDPTW